MDDLKGKMLKVSWAIEKEDGTKTTMYVAGECTEQAEAYIVLKGNRGGEIFQIPKTSILSLRIRK